MRKNEKLFQAFGEIDDKFVAEADPRVKKTGSPFIRISALAACIALVVGAFAYLFVPLSGSSVLSAYADSEYYDIICGVESLKNEKVYKNRFEELMDKLNKIEGDIIYEPQSPSKDDVMESTPDGSTDDNYNETTDNQVEGVIEADIIKRSDTHIFYLNGRRLMVYSIDGEDSLLSDSVELAVPSEFLCMMGSVEMYLSADGKTVTVIYPFVNRNEKSEICIRTIDVSDPTDIKETGDVIYRGRYITSRLTDGKLLLISGFLPDGNINYDKPESFIPSHRTESGTELVAGADIVMPERVTANYYTVVSIIDAVRGEHIDSEAHFSYSGAVYVSRDSVYVTSSYMSEPSDKGMSAVFPKTEITRVDYCGTELLCASRYTVCGTVLDQYSMDEHEGVFRVVTTTVRSADIYCFNKESGELIGSVTDFAPLGEEVTAVRFDGESCYVCTAVRITFTDPVFFFDLSDPSNITYTDTGYIDGFSSSLINYGNGIALGIGEENASTVKIELYREVDGQVVSLSSYTVRGEYSESYKSYFVDRENGLFGFGVKMYEAGGVSCRYVLLSVNDGMLTSVLSVAVDAHPEYMRAVLVDGYLYVLGENDLVVRPL